MSKSSIAYLAAVVVTAAAPGALASDYALQPIQSAGQQVRYDHGRPTISSVKAMGAVQVSPTENSFSKRFTFAIVAFNRAGGPTNIGYENVSVIGPDGTAVPLYTFGQLQREAKAQAARRRFAMALSAMAEAYADGRSAGYSNTYGTANTYSSGTVYGGSRTFQGYGASTTTFRATTYDAAAARAATNADVDRAQADMQAVNAQLDQKLAQLNGDILQTTTVDPNGSSGGLVVAERPKPAKAGDQVLKIDVNLNGELHEFAFSVH